MVIEAENLFPSVLRSNSHEFLKIINTKVKANDNFARVYGCATYNEPIKLYPLFHP